VKDKYKNIDNIQKIGVELEKTSFLIDFSSELLTLVKKTIDPFEDKGYVYNLNQATIVGLYTKLYKHFKLLTRGFNDKEYETVILLSRPIYEAFVLMKYLILKGEESQKHYISPQKNRAVKNKSYFYNCYGKEKEYYIENQG
jgi:hypothetical protein